MQTISVICIVKNILCVCERERHSRSLYCGAGTGRLVLHIAMALAADKSWIPVMPICASRNQGRRASFGVCLLLLAAAAASSRTDARATRVTQFDLVDAKGLRSATARTRGNVGLGESRAKGFGAGV